MLYYCIYNLFQIEKLSSWWGIVFMQFTPKLGNSSTWWKIIHDPMMFLIEWELIENVSSMCGVISHHDIRGRCSLAQIILDVIIYGSLYFCIELTFTFCFECTTTVAYMHFYNIYSLLINSGMVLIWFVVWSDHIRWSHPFVHSYAWAHALG